MAVPGDLYLVHLDCDRYSITPLYRYTITSLPHCQNDVAIRRYTITPLSEWRTDEPLHHYTITPP
jgi:hypothetical protein